MWRGAHRFPKTPRETTITCTLKKKQKLAIPIEMHCLPSEVLISTTFFKDEFISQDLCSTLQQDQAWWTESNCSIKGWNVCRTLPHVVVIIALWERNHEDVISHLQFHFVICTYCRAVCNNLSPNVLTSNSSRCCWVVCFLRHHLCYCLWTWVEILPLVSFIELSTIKPVDWLKL